MKYKVNLRPAIVLLLICILFGFRVTILTTGNNNTTTEELSAAQATIETYVDYIPTVLTFAITAVLAINNVKNNRISCVINAIAALMCLVAVFAPKGAEFWVEYGCYLSLFFTLASLCILPKSPPSADSKENNSQVNRQ